MSTVTISPQDSPRLPPSRPKRGLGWRKPVPPLLDTPPVGSISHFPTPVFRAPSTTNRISATFGQWVLQQQRLPPPRDEPLPGDWRQRIQRIHADDEVREAYSNVNVGQGGRRRPALGSEISSSARSITSTLDVCEEEFEAETKRPLAVAFPDNFNVLDCGAQLDDVSVSQSSARSALPPRPPSRRGVLQIDTHINTQSATTIHSRSRRSGETAGPPSPVLSSMTRRPIRHQPYRRPSLWAMLCSSQPPLHKTRKGSRSSRLSEKPSPSASSAAGNTSGSRSNSSCRRRHDKRRGFLWLCH